MTARPSIRALAGVLAIALAMPAAQAQTYGSPPPPGYPPPDQPPPGYPPPGYEQPGYEQPGQPPSDQAAPGAPLYAPEQLEQMVAPIALYPDPLLTSILTAATYPGEVEDATRWVSDPGNAQLQGDQLADALYGANWDPSVKSLVPFPQVLQMMSANPDWTQQLGDAFLAQQGDVMNAVQALRQQAYAAGTLVSTPQQIVSSDGQIITIMPASPQQVYLPVYDPRYAYGRWDYPDYPPDYFGPPPGYYSGPLGRGIVFGAGIGVVAALWAWGNFDWRGHDIHVDPNRYNRLDNGRPGFTGTTWQHNPAHRGGVPYREPRTGAQFRPNGAPAPRGAPPERNPGLAPRSPAEPPREAPGFAAPNRPEGNRPEPTRIEPNQPEPNRAEPNRPEPNRAEPNRAEPNRRSRTGPRRTKRRRAG